MCQDNDFVFYRRVAHNASSGLTMMLQHLDTMCKKCISFGNKVNGVKVGESSSSDFRFPHLHLVSLNRASSSLMTAPLRARKLNSTSPGTKTKQHCSRHEK
ncbi:hypothetical protein BsWGS_14351 [Bradybaena similaris]